MEQECGRAEGKIEDRPYSPPQRSLFQVVEANEGWVDAHAAIGRGHGADQGHDDQCDVQSGDERRENRYGQQSALNTHPDGPSLRLRGPSSMPIYKQFAALADAASFGPDPSNHP